MFPAFVIKPSGPTSPPYFLAVCIVILLLDIMGVALRFNVRRVQKLQLKIDDWIMLLALLLVTGLAVCGIIGEIPASSPAHPILKSMSRGKDRCMGSSHPSERDGCQHRFRRSGESITSDLLSAKDANLRTPVELQFCGRIWSAICKLLIGPLAPRSLPIHSNTCIGLYQIQRRYLL